MAAHEAANADQLQQFVTCTICSDHYKDPRVLPCSHTFCSACIRQSVVDGKFTCPIHPDRTINASEIETLPVNHSAQDTVEFVSRVHPWLNAKAYASCENCNEKQAVNWCEKCATNLCESCTQSVHSIKIFQSHTPVPLSDKTRSLCPEHTDEKFRFWCTRCDTLVCRDCLLFKHKDHTFSSTKDAAGEASTNLARTMEEIKEMKRHLTQFSGIVRSAMERQRELVRHEMQETAQLFANLQRLLEERKCVLIQQLEDEQVQTMSVLIQQQFSIDQQLQQTTVREICIGKMLDSSDPVQILQFKLALSHNQKEFNDEYRRIDDGCIIQRHTFRKDENDLAAFVEAIERLGSIRRKAHVVSKDGISVKTIPLDISKASSSHTDVISKEQNIARGYKFSLKQPMKLQSVRVQSDHVGQIVAFVVDESNAVVQKGVINAVNATMKWVRIPVECELKHNYGVLVLPPSNNGSYTYKNGDNQFRKINENCAVKSKLCSVTAQLTLGAPLTVINNTHSISMIVDVEE